MKHSQEEAHGSDLYRRTGVHTSDQRQENAQAEDRKPLGTGSQGNDPGNDLQPGQMAFLPNSGPAEWPLDEPRPARIRRRRIFRMPPTSNDTGGEH